jgi:O-antigen/teichoic acid export membrane protein
MSQLIRKTLAQLPAQVGGSLAYFVAMIVWTHYLTPAELGAFAIITAIQELVLVIAYSWWSITTLRYLTSHADADDRRRFDQTDMAVLMAGALLQTVLVLVCVMVLVESARTVEFLAATVLFTVTRNVAAHLTNRVRAELDTWTITILQLVGPIGGLLIGLVVFSTWGGDVLTILWSYTLAQVISIFLGARRLRFTSILPKPDWSILARAFRYGGPSMIGSSFAWVSINGVRFVVGWFATTASVGLLSVGWWLGHRIASFAGLAVVSASFSIAVERIREVGAKAALPQIATNGALLLGVLTPALVGGLAVSDRFVELAVAPDFASMTLIILPIALISGIIHEFRNHFSDQSFLLFERPLLEVWISGTEAVATLIFCFVGLKFYGLPGAVLGCLVANVIAGFASMILAHRAFGIYIDTIIILRIVFASLVMGLAVATAPVPSGLVGLGIVIGLGAGIYAFISIVLFRAEWTQMLQNRSKTEAA